MNSDAHGWSDGVRANRTHRQRGRQYKLPRQGRRLGDIDHVCMLDNVFDSLLPYIFSLRAVLSS